MFDTKKFGEKLRMHRKKLSLTQEDVAFRVGVSPQAVSKWESGECLPDCFNLKFLSDAYGVSLDILLDTESDGDIDTVASKIEQLGDEFIWAQSGEGRYESNAHRDLGDDLWKMWRGLFFIEAGNKELQAEDKRRGDLRIASDYGMKIWDDDGVACIVQSTLRERFTMPDEHASALLSAISSPDGLCLIAALDACNPISKSELSERTGIDISRLNELLLLLLEGRVVEFFESRDRRVCGYKMCAYYGVAAYMVLAAAHILGKPNCTVSEYLPEDLVRA